MDADLKKTVTKAMAGDPAAFEQLIRKYNRLVYAQVYMILNQHEETQDAVQETFLKAYRFRIKLDKPESFLPWLLTIGRNTAKDKLRRRSHAVSVDFDTLLEVADSGAEKPLAPLLRAERRSEVLNAMRRLPDHYREALSLRYLENRNHTSIRRTMGVSEGALRGILGRALRKLRLILHEAPASCAAAEVTTPANERKQ